MPPLLRTRENFFCVCTVSQHSYYLEAKKQASRVGRPLDIIYGGTTAMITSRAWIRTLRRHGSYLPCLLTVMQSHRIKSAMPWLSS